MNPLPPTDEGVTLAWIDKYHQDIETMQREIYDKNILADKLRETTESYRVPEIRKRCDMIEKRIDWRLRRLKHLGQELSEIRTLPLPHMEGTNATATHVDANPL